MTKLGLLTVGVGAMQAQATRVAKTARAQATSLTLLLRPGLTAQAELAQLDALERVLDEGASRWVLLPLAPRLLRRLVSLARTRDDERLAASASKLLARLAGLTELGQAPVSTALTESRTHEALETLDAWETASPTALRAAIDALLDAAETTTGAREALRTRQGALREIAAKHACARDGEHLGCRAAHLLRRCVSLEPRTVETLAELTSTTWTPSCVREACAQALNGAKGAGAARERARSVLRARLAWEPRDVDRRVLSALDVS